MKKILAISGGGAAGAWSVGKLHKENKDYDVIYGVSTGALMAPLVALKKFELLKEAYTSVNNEKIYNISPFTKRGNPRLLSYIFRILTGKKTLGESNNLRKTISEFLSPELFKELKKSGKEVIIAVQNISSNPARIEYYSSKDCLYNDFIDWMYISASAPPVMSIVEKNGNEYVDGGLTELVSINEALSLCDSGDILDVYIHRHLKPLEEKRKKIKNFFHYIFRLLSCIRDGASYKDISEAVKLAKKRKITLNLNYLSEKVQGEFLNFDKEIMKKWYQIGYNNEK